jgi:glutamyl-tRNA synthetase
MANMTIKTRFCPSPTGYIHLGNARTALFNTLLALGQKGVFLLRIEDTDVERSKEEYVTALMEDLRWLGLEWQEGPDYEGGNGPYWQSQRLDIYNLYYQQLEQQGLAYPCFCSAEDLAIMRKIQRAAGKPPRYAGTCYGLSQEEITLKISQGLKPTLRFHVPKDQVVEFHDLVRGLQQFSGRDIGDFIIRRANGTSPFVFCNAIDDALMGVTHVLRGEDHLANTPSQIMILQALNLPIPTYGHISLIVGADGSPLSKRHGSRSIRGLRELGFFPEAINNYMARLGHYYEDDVFMSLLQLAEKFRLENLGRSPARFDYQQLLRWQQEALADQNHNILWDWMANTVADLVPEAKRVDFVTAIRPNILFPEDAKKWAQIFFTEKYSAHPEIIQKAGSQFFSIALRAFSAEGKDFRKISQYIHQELNLKGKELFQPLRVALTGELHGPEMAVILQLLTEDDIFNRLQRAKNMSIE